MSPFSGTVALCMGTRPDIIKMAPVYRALLRTSLRPVVIHTGQHDDLAWPLYAFFGIRPHVALPLVRHRPTLAHLNAQLLDALDETLGRLDAQAVLVHGDTTTALAGAQAAFYRQLPIGHVEAGLRSGHRYDPFPEEMNRMLIGQMAAWHFAPTEGAATNLRRENIDAAGVHVVGNTVVDAAHWGAGRLASYFAREDAAEGESIVSLERFARNRRLVLVTAHRREHWDGPVGDIATAVARLATRHADLAFVWPLHPNPTVQNAVHAVVDALPDAVRARILLTEPMAYPQLLWTMRNAWLVMTDSGGVQEEAASFDRPLLVLRRTTERPEVIEAGGAVLVGTDADDVTAWVERLATSADTYASLRYRQNPFGDGHASTYIARHLETALLPTLVPVDA